MKPENKQKSNRQTPVGWYFSQFRGRWYQRITVVVTTLIVLAYLYIGAVDVNFLGLFGKSPTIECINNPINDEASLIYSSDSIIIGKYYNENRSPVRYEDISPYVIDALISTEDERFYQHHGIDYQGVFAAFKDMTQGKARGASTITQQLVKNMFKIRSQYSTGLIGSLPGFRILVQKSKEWITAIKIEERYDKQTILTLYLNTVDFGSNAYGIKTAAATYFKTTPASLTADQAATLIGLLKATTTYNPRINPENSTKRRNVVLNNMYTHGMLDRAALDSLVHKPLLISSERSVDPEYDGQAQYFREAIREYLADWCKEKGVDLFTDGLKIYTTINTRMQRYAEEAVLQQMSAIQGRFDQHWGATVPWRDRHGKEIEGFIERIASTTSMYKYLDEHFNGNKDSIDFYMNRPHPVKVFTYKTPDRQTTMEMSTMDSIRYMVKYMHCGLVAMEPQTSYVRAWVGDIDFRAWNYDKVTSLRQPGSTFKLFVYGSAFENNNMTPNDVRRDSYFSMKVKDRETGEMKLWAPHNADGKTTNRTLALHTAFAESTNIIAARLGQETGIDNIIKLAKKMGVRSPLDDTPALALGSSDVSLIEMLGAYSCVANDGMYVPPVLVTRIVDRNGEEIYNCAKDIPQPQEAMSYKSAKYLQQLLLAGSHERMGTSNSIRRYVNEGLGIDVGGKTGTSSNHSDAWFFGVTPKLVGGCWVGGEYRCIHFRTGALGQGGKTALPVYGSFMQRVLNDTEFRKEYTGRFPK